MDAILSSFCFDTRKTDTYQYDGWSHCMPPVCFRSVGASFLPEYSIFFLCDSFYVDERTISKVNEKPAFAQHKLLFSALKDTGRLKVIDYRSVIDPYESIIEAGVNRDLRDLSNWRDAFMELVALWNGLARLASENRDFPEHHRMGEEETLAELLESVRFEMVAGMLNRKVRDNLTNWKKALPSEYREYTRRVLAPYLKHVAATLCLSDSLNAVVHDWSDIAPLYKKKLTDSMRIRDSVARDSQAKCEQLIKLMFPQFEPRSAKTLAKALDDPRVQSLRELIDQAVTDQTDFDSDFANRTLLDVLQQERLIDRYHNIVGWLTTPLSLIPWVGTIAEKGVQIGLDTLVKSKLRQRNQWFFWLSEIDNPESPRN